MSEYKLDSRLLYNLKGIVRAIIPRIFTQKSVESKITNIFKTYHNKLDIMAERIAFYHKANTAFEIPKTREELPPESIVTNPQYAPPSRLCHVRVLRPNLDTLNNLVPRKHSTAYYYDTYEYIRYFPSNLLWTFLFNDVDSLLCFPSIVKSRPILESNVNSILMQLNKQRHFCFIKDSIRFEDKQDKVFFRGAAHQEHRTRFFQKYFENPL